MATIAYERSTGDPIDPRFDRLAQTAATGAGASQQPESRPVPNGGFSLKETLRAKPRELTPANLRSATARIVRELAERAESGDDAAQVELYRLYGTLRSQASRAKKALRLPRGESQRESPEIGAAAGRMLRGLADRAAEGDIMALHELAKLRNILRDHTTAAARALNTPDAAGHAYSWREIGQAAGITMQAAQQRWGEKS